MEKEIIGIIAGTLSAASLVPQFIKSVQEKKVNVSLVMLILLIAGNAFWMWYGIKLNSLPIIVTNGFGFLIDLTMLILLFKYGEKK